MSFVVLTLSPQKVAERLGVSRSTIVRWARQGILPYNRLPTGARRFRIEDIEAFERQMRHEATAGFTEPNRSLPANFVARDTPQPAAKAMQ